MWELEPVVFTPNYQNVKYYTISPNSLKNLCPHAQVGGDFDFGGNGPRVKGTVDLIINNDKRSIVAVVKFNAKETKPDWSEVKGTSIYSSKREENYRHQRESPFYFQQSLERRWW